MLKEIKKIINSILSKSYRYSKYKYQYNLLNQIKNVDNLIFIYTMGKVGSTAIYDSILNMGRHEYLPIHFHRLGQKYLIDREKTLKKNIFGNPNKSEHLYKSLLWKPQWIRKSFIEGKQNKVPKYITVIREPVARNISLFFQWIDFSETENSYIFNSRNPLYKFNIETEKDNLEPLYHVFFKVFNSTTHDDWLNNELKVVLKTDIYLKPFNKELGYSLVNQANVKILVLKLEKLKDNFSDAMRELIGLDVSLVSSNEANSKDVKHVYSKFRSEIKFPLDYIDRLYNSQFMNHFYSKEEIDLFKRKWIN